jgi:PAS domain S-box-containing protein
VTTTQSISGPATVPDPWAADDRLHAALDAASLGLWTWTLSTDRVEWSPGSYAVHGVEPGQFDGTAASFYSLVHPQDLPRLQAAIDTALAARTRFQCEFRIVCADGSIRWVANSGVGRYDEEGRCLSVLGTIQDITARRTAEQALQVALEASGTGTFRWDIQDDDLHWDEALDRLFGLEPGKAVRNLEQFVSRVHPDDRAEVMERCRRCRELGHDFEMEFRVVHPDGSVHWLYDRGRTFPDAAGRAKTMTGACVDVTDRKRAQASLTASERFYRRTLESVPGMSFTALDDGFCDYLSEQWSQYTGIATSTHLGRDWVLALHPDDRDRAREAWEGAVARREPYTVEYRMRRHDGAYRWFKARAHLIPETPDGERRWIGTIVDVHDLKEAEAALQERERQLRTITDNTPDIIARFDRSFRHVFVNAAVERVTGLPARLFLGRTNRELGMPPHLCDEWELAFGTVFETGRAVVSQFEIEVEGRPRHFVASIVPEYGPSGEVEQVLCCTRDSTEAWLAQEALRRTDRQKDDFLATLAHELRNPLAPLRNGLTLLQRDVGPAEQRRVKQIMERQLNHMVRLVDELLDVARISQGKLALRRELLPLHSVLDQAVETCRPLLDAQRHALVWEGADLEWHVHGDATRLTQVVGNLLNNAAKYTPPGGTVTLRAAAEGEQLRITVEDTGIGIAPDMLEHVFERFVQVDQHLERAQGGLGIGLSVVKSLVEMHGGRVAAESDGDGRGSRFSVWLPRAQAGHPSAIQVRPGPATSPGSRVLVVDDNKDAAETLALLLETLGQDARVVLSGAAALELAASGWRADLVFLDIGMPRMNGYELAGHLRALPGWRESLLVALTGWGADSDRARSLAAGIDVHLTKPVDPAQVEALLEKLSDVPRTATATPAPLPAQGPG